ncbi:MULTISPECIES: helix-turn-helix transcriptional regulator [unclassified Clostridium]|uniref:helix-turn-helix domain-containing protein n=1 Tax=unclassified Clostridium TaxID=2614128 RepID=UPI000297952F|nr:MULTISPECIES: helix-turn-helix transcriptional regulator [unclassified Clostridium]EKQ56338.1 MAG: putative transcriptional regulator [Clostridium sp. Maddingley MBC34-26]
MENHIIELRYYRKMRKISQRNLAKKMDLTQGYISKIENGIESPTIRMLYRFADALEICPRLLLPCIIKIECKDNNYIKCECELNVNENCNI